MLHKAGLRAIILLMLGAEFLAIVFPRSGLDHVADTLLILVALIGLPFLRKSTLYFVALLTGLSAVAVILGARPWAAVEMLGRATLIVSFLLALQFLRAGIDVHPQIETIRRKFIGIDSANRDGGIVILTFLLASVTNVGAMALSAPLMRAAPVEERQRAAELSVRCVAMTVLWSPFTVGMGIVNDIFPNFPLWWITVSGLLFGVLALAASGLAGQFKVGAGQLQAIVKLILPILAPVILAAIIIIAMVTMFGLNVLAAGIIAIPFFVVGWTIWMGEGALSLATKKVVLSADNFIDDLTLFTLSIVLSALLLDLIASKHLMPTGADLLTPSFFVVAAGALAVALVPYAGIHMVLPATVVLSYFAAVGHQTLLQQFVVIFLVLLGWAFGTILGLASVSLLTASRLFDVSRGSLMGGMNLVFFPILFAIALGFGGLLYSVHP